MELNSSGEPSGSAAPAIRDRATTRDIETSVLGFPCEHPECERSFSTLRGRGVHQRSAHPDWVDERANTVARKARWNPEEKALLARREAQLIRENARFINQELAKTFTERSVEAIKGIRRRASYKSQVQRILEESNEDSSEEAGTPLMVLPTRMQPEHSYNELQDRILEHIKSRPPLEVSDFKATDLQKLCDSLDSLGQQKAKDELALYLLDVFSAAKKARAPRPVVGKKPLSSRKQRRADYARVQNLWRRNRGKCLRLILKDASSAEAPPKEVMIPFWQKIMCQTSEATPGTHASRNILEVLWQPVTDEEIRAAYPSLITAPGPDEISARFLRSMPLGIINRIFNIILWCQEPPLHLLESKTTLIPKKDGAKLPGEFRPITVSSVIIRTLHKVLATRLSKAIQIDPRQRAFQNCDGCAENVFLLDMVLRKHHQKHQPLFMAILDVSKAFDTVSHLAVFDILKSKGLPGPMVEYIQRCYGRGRTALVCGNWSSELFHPECGVKQGDPLSPVIFNLIMDGLLRDLPDEVGVKLGDKTVNALAFADDLILIASTPRGLQNLIDQTASYLAKCGLAINSAKCQTVALKTVPHEKRTVVDKDTIFLCEKIPLPALRRTDQWKYLGIPFTPEGKTRQNVVQELQQMIQKLSKAPLKPQQRLAGLVTVVLPSLYHSLVLGCTHLSVLNKLDKVSRNAVRKWLDLPHDCLNAYFHAEVKEGGLGIPSLRWFIPLKRLQRLKKLRCSGNENGDHSSFLSSEISKALMRLKDRGTLLDEERALKARWADLLHKAPDGKALRDSKKVPQQHRWVQEGTRFLSGRDFVHLNKLRINALPVRSRTSRGRTTERQCRAGCSVPETLNHVLQQCHRTHGARVRRHDAMVKYIHRALQNNGLAVEIEPHFKTSEGLRKPDIVVNNGKRTIVVDAQVVSEQTDLDEAHRQKVSYYKNLESIIKDRYGAEIVTFTSATINCRGVWSRKSANDLINLSIIKTEDLKVLSTRTLIGGLYAFRMFNAVTSTQWKKRTGVG